MVALAHSEQDDVKQRQEMWDVLKRNEREGRKDLLIEFKGKHDEIWREAKS